MAIVGTAEVRITANTTGVEAQLSKAFTGAMAKARGPMEREAANTTKAVQRTIDRNPLELKPTFNATAAVRESERAGRRMGTTLGGAFENTATSSFAKSAKQAADAFTVQLAKLNTIGIGVTNLIGGLSSLVSSLYLVGQAAVQAAASGAALVGSFAAIAQGAVATVVATRGIGDAISAGFKSAEAASKSSAATTIAEARRVADARARIVEVQRAGAERLADADRRIADAERDLNDAQRDALQAQRDLNRAREDGLEELQQLGFAVEDAALAEERAALRLEDAYTAMREAQSLPADSKARQEAELSFKEADLNYRKAKDRASDLGKEQQEAAKKGVNGTKAVVDAQKQYIDAQNKVADAEQKLQDSRRNKDDVAADNARDLAKAQLALSRALEDAARGAGDAATAAAAYQAALDKLSPSGQRFVKLLVGQRNAFNEFKKSVQEPFFASFVDTFERLITGGTFDKIVDALSRTSAVMGELANDAIQSLIDNSGMLTGVMDGLTGFLEIFTTESENGKSAIENLTVVILGFLQAIQPVTDRFGKWIAQLINGSELATNTGERVDELTGFFERAGDRAAEFGDIFGSIGDIFSNIADASGPAVNTLMGYLVESFDDLATATADNKEGIGTFFEGVVANVQPILDLIGELSLVFLELGADKSVGEFFRVLNEGVGEGEDAVPGLADSLRGITGALADSGPGLAELIVKIAHIFDLLADSGIMDAFFDSLNSVADVMIDVFSNSYVQNFLKAAAPWIGAFKAASVLFLGSKIAGKVLFGYFSKISGIATGIGNVFKNLRKQPPVPPTPIGKTTGAVNPAISTAAVKAGAAPGVLGTTPAIAANTDKATKSVGRFGKAVGGVGKGLSLLGGPIGLLLLFLPMLIDIFKDLYENNKGFKKAIDGIVDVFGMLAGILGQALVPIIEMLGDVFAQLVPQIMPLIVMLVNTLAPILVMLVKMLARALMPVIMILARVIATVLPIIIEAFMPILEAVIPIIGMLVKTLARILIPVIMALMPIILELLDVFLSVFMPILDIIVPIIQFLANLLSRVLVGALKILLPIVQWVMNRIVDLVTIGLSIFKWAWRNLVKPALGWFKDGIEAVVGWVEGVVDGIGDAWEGIKEAFAGPINWVKKQINKWLIDPLNTIISAFGGDKIARLKIEGTSVGVRGGSGFTRYADGGPVIGPGGPRDDKINAKLSNGEYVLNHRMVKQAGGFTALERWRGGQGGPADLWNKVLDFVSTPVKWLKDTMVGSINGMIENIVKPGMKLLPDNFVGNFIRGMINGALGAVSDRGKEVDKAQAPVYAGRNAPPYKGPPGGWTFPTGYTGYTTYPSGSHLYAGAIDIPVAAGTAVRAVSVGRITRAGSGPHWTYGNVVFISHANGLESRYAHLRRPVGRVGSIVRTGQIIGISGGVPGEPGAGRTTGAHLHFELNPNRYGYPAGAAKMLRSLGARFATGGVVKPTAGGLMALLGEAGKHERVEPLDRDGLSVRDRAIIEKLAGQYGGGNTVVRVYIGDQELTDIVRTEIVDASERTARQISVGRRR